jgi:alpha-tubulin suppressor-like RCC1 family protein
VSGAAGVVQLDASYRVACGLDADGAAYCWGDNGYGQLGVSDASVYWSRDALPVESDVPFVQVSAGSYHACGLTAGGQVYCWGSPLAIGIGDTHLDPFHPTPELVALDRTFIQVSAGQAHTCALDSTGQAWCWGRNRDGEVGSGELPSGGTFVASPVPVVGGHRFVQIAAGGFHVCGLTEAGKAWCWGLNSDGQLGIGRDETSSPAPLAVSGGHTFTSLFAGYIDTCGLTSAGTAYCWGGDYSGDLGVETGETCAGGLARKCAREPTALSGGLTFSTLAPGWGVTCGLTPGGEPYCWGLKKALGAGM